MFERTTQLHPLHPTVARVIADKHTPADPALLHAEWPHKAEDAGNEGRLAYSRNNQPPPKYTVTTVSKYLTRHFPTLPSHTIRDYAALDQTDSCFIVDTMPQMLYHLINGPKSCMSNGTQSDSEHPYRAYDPEHGWRMAVRIEAGQTVGRALVNVDGACDEVNGVWVRTYKYQEGSSYSPSDTVLEAWLRDNGYNKTGDWDGFNLAWHASSRGEFVAPYLDGGCQNVDVRTGRRTRTITSTDNDTGLPVHTEISERYQYLNICHGGEWDCSSTQGYAEAEEVIYCDHCDDRVHEDDLCGVGYEGNTQVCERCYDRHYTTVIGRRGREYAIDDYDVVWVDDQGYDGDYLEENNIVFVPSRVEYYHTDDCVKVEGEWQLEDDCVKVDDEWVLKTKTKTETETQAE